MEGSGNDDDQAPGFDDQRTMPAPEQNEPSAATDNPSVITFHCETGAGGVTEELASIIAASFDSEANQDEGHEGGVEQDCLEDENHSPRSPSAGKRTRAAAPRSFKSLVGLDKLHEFALWLSSDKDRRARIYDVMAQLSGLTCQQWTGQLTSRGYPKEEDLQVIFTEIVKESSFNANGCWEGAAPDDGGGGGGGGGNFGVGESDGEDLALVVIASQLDAFERRMSLVGAQAHSRGGRLLEVLLQRYGSSLIGWRRAVDKTLNGIVPYGQLVKSCRELDLTPQVPRLWEKVRAEGRSALEFYDLDPEEGRGIEELADKLWNHFGLDIAKAWPFFDRNNQQYLSFDVFAERLQTLGFKGDVRTLFRGLDLSTVGRVKREDIEYAIRCSRVGRRWLLRGKARGDPVVAEFLAWVQRDFGNFRELAIHLQISPNSGPVPVGDLAARLTALGFEGDSLLMAKKAGRSDGGARVTLDSLYNLIVPFASRALPSGAPPRTQGRPKSSPHRAGQPHDRAAHQRHLDRKASPEQDKRNRGWNESVEDIGASNGARCKYNRNYFLPPSRDDHQASVSFDARGMPPQRVQYLPWAPNSQVAARNPGWTHNYGHTAQDVNVKSSAPTRTLFKDYADKPVKQEIKERVSARLSQSDKDAGPPELQHAAGEPAALVLVNAPPGASANPGTKTRPNLAGVISPGGDTPKAKRSPSGDAKVRGAGTTHSGKTVRIMADDAPRSPVHGAPTSPVANAKSYGFIRSLKTEAS